MSESPSPPPESQPKKLSLNDLLPEKAAVDTSLGPRYVRHTYSSDWKHFEGDDSVDLGRAAVQRLVNRVGDKRDSTPLADEDVAALIDADFVALVPTIAKRSDWGDLQAGAGLLELGDAVKSAKAREADRNRKMMDDMRKSIGSSYAFLEKSTLEKLQGQMTGLAGIRDSISMSATESLKAAMGSAGLSDRLLKDAFSGTRSATDALRDLNRGVGAMGIESPRTIEIPRIPMPPRPEDTRLGRATLESAENSRDAAQKMHALVEVVGGLNQTLVKDVLPAWFKQVESDQHQAEEAFRQAGRSLWWTKWAVIASVVVSLLATWWQISVAREIDRENSASQRTSESLLREQLAAQQKLAEQKALEVTQLRQFAEQQTGDAEKLRKLLDSKLSSQPARK